MKIFCFFLLSIYSTLCFSQVPTTGLVAYYPFSGNANDFSGNNYNGTIYGPTLCSDRFGNLSSAYSFDGVNDYIDLTSHIQSFNFQQPATISFWLNTKYDTPGSIYSLTDSANGLYGCGIFIGNNTTNTLTNELIITSVQVNLTDKYIAGITTTNRNILINTGWHNVVSIFDGISTKFYIDTVLYTISCNYGTNNGHYGNITIAKILTIGTRYANGLGAYYHGFLDDIRIYNRVLSNSEISSLFNETVTSIPINQSNSINISPNPSHNNINFSFAPESIKIYNNIGIEVYNLININEITNIDITQLKNGLYIVRLKKNNKVYYTKFIKN